MKLRYVVKVSHKANDTWPTGMCRTIVCDSFPQAYEKLLNCWGADVAELEVWNYEELITVIKGGKGV